MKRSHAHAAAILAAALLSVPAHASIIGKTVRIDVVYSTNPAANLTSGNVTVVDPGVEFTAYNVAADIGDGTVTFSSRGIDYFIGATFNGFRITDVLGQIDAFTSLQLISGSGLSILPAATFTADQLSFNFTPTHVNNYTTSPTGPFSYTWRFAPASNTPAPPPPSSTVPEPGTLALVSLAAFGVFATRRRSVA